MASPSQPLPTLIPEDDLLRVLRNRTQEQDTTQAFFLRNDERVDGLSVRFRCSYPTCRADFHPSYGVLALTVQSVLSLTLTVIPDAIDHANIQGLPHKDDEPSQATYFARRLSEASRLVDAGKQP
jgi:hypothetical protein